MVFLLMTNPKENPKNLAARNEKRVPLHLIPPIAEIAMARVMELGATKYGAWNWRDTPIGMSEYIGAIKRHTNAIAQCDDIDSESGQSHLAHIMATCAILLDANHHGTLIDDRYKGVDDEKLHKDTNRG